MRFIRKDITDITMKGKVVFEGFTLIKTVVHAYIHSDAEHNFSDFKMVIGLLGGVIIDEDVHVQEAGCMRHGTRNDVEFGDEQYLNAARLDSNWGNKRKFITGWYCSLPREGTFQNEGNFKLHKGYQGQNPKAIAMQIRPQHVSSYDMNKVIKVYRLKDPSVASFGEFIEIPYKMTINERTIFTLSREALEEYKKSSKMSKMSDWELNSFLDEWLEKKVT